MKNGTNKFEQKLAINMYSYSRGTQKLFPDWVKGWENLLL